MIDYCKELVSALSTVLPTQHELALTSKTKTPCISWQERNNYHSAIGDTLGYSYISFTVKVWSNKVAELMSYARAIDKVLRPMGFKLIASSELYDVNSTMIQKILTYEVLAKECY